MRRFSRGRRVSIHAPARGATSLARKPVPKSSVSIHAPARGATLPERIAATVRRVSIHAPARGATPRRGVHSRKAMFQSTLPRGERPQRHCWALQIDFVSIHAPARGATNSDPTPPPGSGSFNPRSREGSDSASHKTKMIKPLFQSTLPRGERRPFNARPILDGGFQSTLPRGERPTTVSRRFRRRRFNPRSREGSDADTAAEFGVPAVSIHAPARGATFECGDFLAGGEFQSTLPRGERLTTKADLTYFQGFNPRSREGSDISREDFFTHEGFQSTLPRGERR